MEEAKKKVKSDYTNRMTIKQKELELAVVSGDTDALEYYQGHINVSSATGAIVASIIGGLIMLALFIFLMCKALKKM